MIRQVLNFQKCFLMNNMGQEAAKSVVKNENYKSYSILCYIIFGPLMVMTQSYITTLAFFLLFLVLGIMFLNLFFRKDRAIYETLPIKKRFIVGNIMFFYVEGAIMAFVCLLATGILMIVLMFVFDRSSISGVLSPFGSSQILGTIRFAFFVFMAGYCLYAFWFLVHLINTKWLRFTIAGAVATVMAGTAIFLRLVVQKNNNSKHDPIYAFTKSLAIMQYWLIIGALIIFLTIMYIVCVRMYKRVTTT